MRTLFCFVAQNYLIHQENVSGNYESSEVHRLSKTMTINYIIISQIINILIYLAHHNLKVLVKKKAA